MALSKKLFIILLLLPFISIAQGNYKPGYVVTLKGDTLRGLINYREWDSNPNSISFKKDATDKKDKVFTPNDIACFNITNLDSYLKYSGPVSMDLIDPNRISYGRDTSFKIATIFLKVLQNGDRVNLYSYTDNLKTRFYIKETTDTIPIELIYHSYFSNNSTSNGRSVDENTYLRQLLTLGQKYKVLDDSFQWDIEHSGYNRQALLKLTSEINGIGKAEYQRLYDTKTTLKLFAGVALSVSSIKPTGPYQKTGGVASTSLFPAVLFGFNLPMNPNTGKLMLGAELNVSGNQYKSIYIYTGSPYVPVKYSFNQFWVTLAPQVTYNFYNTAVLKIYAGAGLAITFRKYYNSTYDINYAASVSSNNPISGSSFFNTFSTPLLVKAGAMFNNKLGIFITYLTNAPVSKDDYFTVNFSTIQAGVNYFFE